MFYIDTSVLVSYYCPEKLSEVAEEFLINHNDLAISWLTGLEIYSAISRKIRINELSKFDGQAIRGQFVKNVEDNCYFLQPINKVHYESAREIIGHFNNSLRSLDALHLAIARQDTYTLVTADKVLAESAESLNIAFVYLSA